LFRSKRSKQLAKLLVIRQVFEKFGLGADIPIAGSAEDF
jgi:hypothetical protein